MKRQLILLLFIIVSVKGITQDTLKKNLILSKSNYTSAELLKELISKHNLNIYYNAGDIDSSKQYSFNSGSAEELLFQIGKRNNLDYTILYNQVILKKKKNTKLDFSDRSFNNSFRTEVEVKPDNSQKTAALNILEGRKITIKDFKEMKLKKDYNSKFRKRLVAFTMAAVIASNTNTFSQFDIGITAGTNFSTISDLREESQSKIPGFQLGLTMVTPINKNVHFRNDVIFNNHSVKLSYPIEVIPGLNRNFTFSEDISVYSMRIPLTINYVIQKSQMNFYFGLGGYYEMMLSGKKNIKWKNESFNKNVQFSKRSDYYDISILDNSDTAMVVEASMPALNRNQLGLAINLGLSRKSWIFNFSFEPSMTQYPIEGYGHLNQFRFSVTYLFGRVESKE